MFFTAGWQELFIPEVPLVEIFIRGSIVYLALFTLMRLVLNRVAGTVGLADLLLVVLIADAAQNAMAGGYRTITEGIILVTTIIFWNHTLNWLGFRFPSFQRFFNPPPLPLVKNGRILMRNMRKEFITEDELMSELRHLGIANLDEVEKAWMEGDGRISAIRWSGFTGRRSGSNLKS